MGLIEEGDRNRKFFFWVRGAACGCCVCGGFFCLFVLCGLFMCVCKYPVSSPNKQYVNCTCT